MNDECCPCDAPEAGCLPDIPAGLDALPRQLASFPEYRRALLQDIPNHPSLSQWRAREGDDTGIMLLEMWAYVLDIVGFYDERIANESYLRTAMRRPSLRKLVGLIGYQPRPALAASVILAAIADGNKALTLPARTGFRSDAFADEAPQIFETESEQIISPRRNQWPMVPVRARFPGPDLTFLSGDAVLPLEQMVLVRWNKTGQTVLRAGRVATAETIDALDGSSYLQVTLTPALTLDTAVALDQVEFFSPGNSAALHVPPAPASRFGKADFGLSAVLLSSSAISASSSAISAGGSAASAVLGTSGLVSASLFASSALASVGPVSAVTGLTAAVGAFNFVSIVAVTISTLQLDSLYPELGAQDELLIQRGAQLHAARITAVSRADVASSGLDDSPTLAVTAITVTPALPAGWSSDPSQLLVHFNMSRSGQPLRIAKTHLQVADFAAPGIAIDGTVEPLAADESIGQFELLDAQDNGVLMSGSVDIDSAGSGRVRGAQDTLPFEPPLRTPVTVFGNLVAATRGESVFNEVLGSGNGALPQQTFILAKSPLTYINDPDVADGRRSTLEVRVNGIAWLEVASFFGVAPEDEVFIVRHNDDEEAVISFGDGIRGARLPTGVNNVSATYRHGAGAAKPPASTIGQLARPVTGLRRIVNPVAAGGGADRDQPEDIRDNAPATALLLGRAISIQDFTALAREFGGVVNAHVEWAWDKRSQGAVVMVWFISDGGDIADELQHFLIGQADPDTPLVAVPASAQSTLLTIELVLHEGFSGSVVEQAALDALTDADDGLLSAGNIPIGQPLFSSEIFARLATVPGVHSVSAMTVDGRAAPVAITTAQGTYRVYQVTVSTATVAASI